MRSVFLLMVAVLVGCDESERVKGNFEIDWAGRFYACTDGYEVSDGFYKFTNLRTSELLMVPESKIETIRVGCYYYE